MLVMLGQDSVVDHSAPWHCDTRVDASGREDTGSADLVVKFACLVENKGQYVSKRIKMGQYVAEIVMDKVQHRKT